MRIGAFLLMGIALVVPALAQAPAPNDSITVTGTPAQQAITRFVEASVTPTRMTGKTARWETPICVGLQGIKPEDGDYIVRRLKRNAADAGVRVNARKDCDPNIEIAFTDQPQATMDQVKESQPDLLGYADSPEERDRLATVTRPIQAWYRTATQDIRGHSFVDGSRADEAPARGTTAVLPCANTSGNRQLVVANGMVKFVGVGTCFRQFDAIKANVPGFAIQDGLRSQFDHITIVVDSDKVARMKADAVTDYISMVALAQLSSLGTCQGLTSITNLLVRDCALAAESLTVNDRGYLRGVYQADPTLAPQTQKNQIASQMEKAIEDQ
jgi:hypothetical protein